MYILSRGVLGFGREHGRKPPLTRLRPTVGPTLSRVIITVSRFNENCSDFIDKSRQIEELLKAVIGDQRWLIYKLYC